MLLSLSISLTSIILYLFLTLLGNNLAVWIAALFVSLLLLAFIYKHSLALRARQSLPIHFTQGKQNLSFILIILLFIFAKAYVLSPLVITKTVNSFEHIQVTPVGDYYKHNFVVTLLAQDGIPPGHPYFPQAKLSYYYGYYLIPASFYKVFNIFPNYAFYIFFLITDFLGLLILLSVLKTHLTKYSSRLLALLLLLFGAGVNIFPRIWGMESIFSTSVGFQLINTFKAFLYVPQHFFAACLTVGLINEIIFRKPKILNTTVTVTFILLSSIFVSSTLAIWLILIFVFLKHKRLLLFLSALLTTLLIIPYVLQLSDRENLFYFNNFTPFIFFENSLTYLNPMLTAFFQYGPLVFILAFLLLVLGKQFIKKHLVIILGFLMPLFITWIIRSPLYNDLSMRSLMPLQFSLPILFIKFIEVSKNKFLKNSLLLISVIVLVFGFYSFYLEYSNQWKARLVLHPNVSELLFKVREFPDSTKLAALDRDRWVEFIPSIGFKKVLSPFLFDSFVFFVGDLTPEHGQYERMALDLFIDHNIGKTKEALVEQKNMQMSKLFTFVNMYQADWLILNNQLWVKQDINPWLVIFEEMGVKIKPLTSNYTLLNYSSLVDKTSKYKISVDNEGLTIPIKEKQFPLKEGLWYLASCSNKGGHLFFELEDYFLIFNQDMDGNNKSCAGKIFYLKQNEEVRLTNNSNIEVVYAYPLKLEPN